MRQSIGQNGVCGYDDLDPIQDSIPDTRFTPMIHTVGADKKPCLYSWEIGADCVVLLRA
jgi:hypothetical protein